MPCGYLTKIFDLNVNVERTEITANRIILGTGAEVSEASDSPGYNVALKYGDRQNPSTGADANGR